MDSTLSEAWDQGILLAGMSAGAMCWFETGLGGSFEQGNYGLQRGLGLIQGACAAHYSNTNIPGRRINFLSEMRLGRMPRTLAIDDRAAVLFADREIEKTVSWAPGSTAYRVEKIDDEILETPLAAVQLRDITGP
ncbi:MAG: Type 1 glutamine amidotransferase-like domain-containing protein [Caballeronia sp.]